MGCLPGAGFGSTWVQGTAAPALLPARGKVAGEHTEPVLRVCMETRHGVNGWSCKWQGKEEMRASRGLGWAQCRAPMPQG